MISSVCGLCADFHPEGGCVAVGQVLRRFPHLQPVLGAIATAQGPFQTAQLVVVQVLRHRRAEQWHHSGEWPNSINEPWAQSNIQLQ